MIVAVIVVVIVGGRFFRKEDDPLHGAEEGLFVEAEVEKGAEEHVAGDSGEAVEIESFHWFPPKVDSGLVRAGSGSILSFPGHGKREEDHVILGIIRRRSGRFVECLYVWKSFLKPV